MVFQFVKSCVAQNTSLVLELLADKTIAILQRILGGGRQVLESEISYSAGSSLLDLLTPEMLGIQDKVNVSYAEIT